MKKILITTAAAAALFAAPYAGKADAAQIQPIQTKVVYYNFNTMNLSDSELYDQIFKQLNIKLDKNNL